MNNGINAADFFKHMSVFSSKLYTATAAAAKRSGIAENEAEALMVLYYSENDVLLSELERRGFSVAAKNLVDGKLAEKTGDKVKITGRGKIAGKSISLAQEKFLTAVFADVTPEEGFILANVMDKILSKY